MASLIFSTLPSRHSRLTFRVRLKVAAASFAPFARALVMAARAISRTSVWLVLMVAS